MNRNITIILIIFLSLFLIAFSFLLFNNREDIFSFFSSSEDVSELSNEEVEKISSSIIDLRCEDKSGNEIYGSGISISKEFLEEVIDQNKKEEKHDLDKPVSNFDESLPFIASVPNIPAPVDLYVADLDNGYILTNAHVAELKVEKNKCSVYASASKYFTGGYVGDFYYDEMDYFLDERNDIALLQKEEGKDSVIFGVGFLDDYGFSTCSSEKLIGSNVYIFGYPSPAFELETREPFCAYNFIKGYENIPCNKEPDISISKRNLIISKGMISGINSKGNYYTDAKIDAGSSGGLAVSKIDGQVCIVGIPTWLSGGEYENLGVIQPINEIKELLINRKSECAAYLITQEGFGGREYKAEIKYNNIENIDKWEDGLSISFNAGEDLLYANCKIGKPKNCVKWGIDYNSKSFLSDDPLANSVEFFNDNSCRIFIDRYKTDFLRITCCQ